MEALDSGFFTFGGGMRGARQILLDAGDHQGAIRFLGDRVDARELAEGQRKTVTATRAGTFFYPGYGEFELPSGCQACKAHGVTADKGWIK